MNRKLRMLYEAGLFAPEDFDSRIKDMFLQAPEEDTLVALEELERQDKSRIRNVSAHMMNLIKKRWGGSTNSGGGSSSSSSTVNRC